MSLRDHLQDIYERRGHLTPELVVEEARPKTSPLHDRFEWDDKIAGPAWRRQQAHELIRSVRVVYREATDTDPAQDVRAWHAIRAEDGHIYKPAEEVAEDATLTAILLKDMEREWKALYRRYGQFQEFLALIAATIEEAA